MCQLPDRRSILSYTISCIYFLLLSCLALNLKSLNNSNSPSNSVSPFAFSALFMKEHIRKQNIEITTITKVTINIYVYVVIISTSLDYSYPKRLFFISRRKLNNIDHLNYIINSKNVNRILKLI